VRLAQMRIVYLLLAIWGAIMPMRMFVRWFNDNGWSLAGMMQAWAVNDATRGLTWDLTISAIALTVWILAEVWRGRNWLGLIAIPATFGIGVSCGLPLYLALRKSRTA